jgi:Domain of unknown function (DUF4838)
MNRKIRIFFSLLTLMIVVQVLVAGEAEPRAYIVKDGKSLGRIYLPQNANRPLLFAAEELKLHLKKMTGANVQYAWRSPTGADSGFVLEVRPEEAWKGKESAQAFTITEIEKPRPLVRITGNTGLGVLYGVYQYLSDQGVRWFEPGEIGTNIPKLTVLEVKKRKKPSSPSFRYRCLDFSGWHSTHFDYSDKNHYREVTHHEYDLWLLRNHLIFDRSIHGKHYFDFNRVASSARHGLKSKCNLNPRDLKKEPERFPLVTRKGKKVRVARGAQICFTNETNIRNAVESAVAYFRKLEATAGKRNTDLDEIADVVDMSLADHAGICECDACATVAGTGPRSKDRLVWSFMNRVAKELNRRMPGKKIMLFAPYYELTRPPADIKIESNIIAIACRSHAHHKVPENRNSYPFIKQHKINIETTIKAGAEMQAYDYILWQNTPQPLDVLDAAQFYAENGFIGYHAEVMQRNELAWPILWTLARFTWDAKQDPQLLLKQYCMEYYGKENGAIVLDVLRRINARSRKIYRIIYGGPADTSAMLSDELIKSSRTRLAVAKKSVRGKELERISRFSDSLEVQMQFAETYRAFCTALNERTPNSINAFKKRAAAFKTFSEANKTIRFCSPGLFKLVQRFEKVDIAALKPKGRVFKTEAEKQRELFAGTSVPARINNLFYLPENWKFRIDIHEEGLNRGWEKPGFNDAKWPLLSTHNVFEAQGYTKVGGRFWHRTKFTAPRFPKGRRVMLRIGSIDDDGEVYLNGKLVAKTTDAKNWDKSFAIDVTGVLKQGGENTVVVRGYDATGAGGLWRPCALYTVQ